MNSIGTHQLKLNNYLQFTADNRWRANIKTLSVLFVAILPEKQPYKLKVLYVIFWLY